MARIKTKTHEIVTNQCGNCGVMLPKDFMLFEKCKRCGVVVEP